MSFKTPNLIDVPKDRPTRKERLDAFKEQHDIFTYGSKGTGWDAMLVKHSREALSGYSDTIATDQPIELVMGYCRLLIDAHLMVAGDTERRAIAELCRLNNIPFDP